MRAGVITFHWAANYGAVLQAYALQKAIEKIGIECEIVDYYPSKYKRKIIDCIFSRNIKSFKRKVLEIQKEKKINHVIEDYMTYSEHYESDVDLKKNPPIYDIYISGSDQIWNPDFTLNGDSLGGHPYYLDFAIGKKKISYASSIGSVNLSEDYWNAVLPKLKSYQFITVREESTKNILKDQGITATVVPDPTILLTKDDYAPLTNKANAKFVYYILQENQRKIHEIKNMYLNEYCSKETKNLYNVNIKDWLGYIQNAELILTNSYHCVIFSILFHKKFLVVPIEGQLEGMNTRFDTLLGQLGLKERMVKSVSEANEIRSADIDWEGVDKRLDEYRKYGYNVLQEICKG